MEGWGVRLRLCRNAVWKTNDLWASSHASRDKDWAAELQLKLLKSVFRYIYKSLQIILHPAAQRKPFFFILTQNLLWKQNFHSSSKANFGLRKGSELRHTAVLTEVEVFSFALSLTLTQLLKPESDPELQYLLFQFLLVPPPHPPKVFHYIFSVLFLSMNRYHHFVYKNCQLNTYTCGQNWVSYCWVLLFKAYIHFQFNQFNFLFKWNKSACEEDHIKPTEA